jgi:hypothetical protein
MTDVDGVDIFNSPSLTWIKSCRDNCDNGLL